MTKSECYHCGKESVSASYERAGQAFSGQQHIQAGHNQYLVTYQCEECGAFHGCRVDDIEEVEREAYSKYQVDRTTMTDIEYRNLYLGTWVKPDDEDSDNVSE